MAIKGYESERIRAFNGDDYLKVWHFDQDNTLTGGWYVYDADSLKEAIHMIERQDSRAARLY